MNIGYDVDGICKWGLIPDYIEDVAWGMQIIDSLLNSVNSLAYIQDWSSYISDITIPNQSIKIETTNYDMFTDVTKEEFGQISISFFDNVVGSAYKFFYMWLNSIYDFKNNVLHKGWKNERKKIMLYYYRINNVAGKAVPTKPLNFMCENCLPISLGDISLSTDGSGRTTFTVNLVCKRTYLCSDFGVEFANSKLNLKNLF